MSIYRRQYLGLHDKLTVRDLVRELLLLAGMGLFTCMAMCKPEIEPATPKDIQDSAKCAAAHIKCVDMYPATREGLEQVKECRANVRATCNDGGAP